MQPNITILFIEFIVSVKSAKRRYLTDVHLSDLLLFNAIYHLHRRGRSLAYTGLVYNITGRP